jgi:hypothetical protein
MGVRGNVTPQHVIPGERTQLPIEQGDWVGRQTPSRRFEQDKIILSLPAFEPVIAQLTV